MTTQELKEYINKTLGNSIRCLLPSYWWKRLFGLVVDKVAEVDGKVNKLPTKSYIDDAVKGKQDALVSGTNIKTINRESILGVGDIDINSKTFITLDFQPDSDGIKEQNFQIWLQFTDLVNKGEILPPVRIKDDYVVASAIIYPHNYFITIYDDVYAYGFLATITDTNTLENFPMKYLLTGYGEIIKTAGTLDVNILYIGNITSTMKDSNKSLLKLQNQDVATTKLKYYTSETDYIECSIISIYSSIVLVGNFYKNCIVVTVYYNGNFEEWYVINDTGETGKFTPPNQS